MILVDSTVIIAFLRTRDARLFAIFQAHQASVTGVVRAEILSGVHNTIERNQTVISLDLFLQTDIPYALWDRIGNHRQMLVSKGVNVPFNDIVLATLAIHYDVEIWSRDRHFPMMQNLLPALRLFQEPTP